MSKVIETYPAVAAPQPEGTHRNDMTPERALWELLDLWGSGALDDRNAAADLEEVMGHLYRLFEMPVEGNSNG